MPLFCYAAIADAMLLAITLRFARLRAKMSAMARRGSAPRKGKSDSKRVAL